MEDNREEARWWFGEAERMLRDGDWLGCRTCAIRARDIDPRLSGAVDEMVVIASTLSSGERRTVTNQPDWYAILGLAPSQGRDMDAVATRFHNLVYILNPQRNMLPYAERAIGMVYDAWSVLSDPARKTIYDRDLGLNRPRPLPPPQPQPQPVNDPMVAIQHNFRSFGQPPRPLHVGSGSSIGAPVQVQRPEVGGQTRGRVPQRGLLPGPGAGSEVESVFSWSEMFNVLQEGSWSWVQPNQNQNQVVEKSTFWTVCPYCLFVYEYQESYTNRAMTCQNCRKVFHAVVIETPPSPVAGQEAYHACWGTPMPFGHSIQAWNNRNGAGPSNAAPPMLGLGNTANGGHAGANEIVEILSSDDEDEKKLVGDNANGVEDVYMVEQAADGTDVYVPDFGLEMGDADAGFDPFREPGTGTSAEEDELDGYGLFEGLDEYLRSLPSGSEDKADE